MAQCMIEPEIFLAMVLNYIWIAFFLVAFVVAVGRTLFAVILAYGVISWVHHLLLPLQHLRLRSD